MYRNFCNKRSGSWNIKRLLLIKENQISQVKELSTFLYMRKCKSLGSLKSFLWHALQASRASILCFLILSLFTPSRVGECCRWWIFFVFILSFLWLHTWVQLVVMWRLHGCTVSYLTGSLLDISVVSNKLIFHTLLQWPALNIHHVPYVRVYP